MKRFEILGLLVLYSVTTVFSATSEKRALPLQQCEGQNIEDLENYVTIDPCGKSRCKLRKGSNVTVTMLFRPEKEVKTLTTEVYGVVGGISLPFIGVAGTSACASLVRADSGDSASCPLEPGVQYKYTKVFPIESFYPSLEVKVHWALNDGNKDLICFEIPAVIK